MSGCGYRALAAGDGGGGDKGWRGRRGWRWGQGKRLGRGRERPDGSLLSTLGHDGLDAPRCARAHSRTFGMSLGQSFADARLAARTRGVVCTLFGNVALGGRALVGDLLPDLGNAVAGDAALLGVARAGAGAHHVAHAASPGGLELCVVVRRCLEGRAVHVSQIGPSTPACRVSAGDGVSAKQCE